MADGADKYARSDSDRRGTLELSTLSEFVTVTVGSSDLTRVVHDRVDARSV
jgi:hypothetical protein